MESRGAGDNPVQCPEITTNYLAYTRRPFPVSRLSLSLARPSHRISASHEGNPGNYEVHREVSIRQERQQNGVANASSQERRKVQSVQSGASTRQAVAIVATIFLTSLLALFYIYMKFPELEEAERQHVKLPWDIEDAKKLGKVLDRYKEKYFFEVILAVFVIYIFLQTFAIPGSISLSILSGFLFPFPVALVLICFCSATGASLCYLLSYFLGRRIVYKYFPDRAIQWAGTVNRHRSHLLNYILFLRVTPFLPNWFINIVSPVIDVPLFPFWLGTFLGVAPPSFVAIQAGQTLYELSAASGTWSWNSVILLGVFALLSLAPVLLKKRLRDKFE